MVAGDPHGRSIRVFISSTYIDNAERRKVVADAVARAGMQPVGMERFNPSHRPTVEECERLARACDVYVGIVAHRYGWIPDGRETSITEIEYDAAKAAGRPRYVLEIDPELPVYPDKDFDPGPERWTKQQKLEAFRKKYRADQMPGLFKETTLSGMVVQCLNDWRRERQETAKAAPRKKAPAARRASDEIARYCRAAEAQHEKLELAGFKTKLRVPVGLEELYVPLHAMVDLRGVGEAAFGDAADAEKRLRAAGAASEIPLSDAFREAKKRSRRGLVILGDPGSGKTTHLRRLLLWCLRRGTAGLGLDDDVLPVFLALRNLRDMGMGLDAFIEQELDSPHLRMPEGFGARLRERGRLLLLFDGLDEVADEQQRAVVSRWIEKAAEAWPTSTAVVTCRFAGYGGKARLGERFLELHLRPLTREQSEEFIRNWYRIVETGLAADPAQGEVTARIEAEKLVHRLRDPDNRSVRLLEMTRNPLLLANLCLVHRDRGALPRGRAGLYGECIEVLLERWREAKGLSVGVDARAGQRVLQPAALWLHEKDQRTRAPAAELAPVLEPALAAVKWQGGGAREFLRTVRDESGLLTGWGQDEYGFMHLGFQEYLAAREIRRRYVAGDTRVLRDLAARYGESWWQEVTLILLALGDPSLFEPLMREVVGRYAFGQGASFLDLILEESAEVSARPFVELIEKEPGGSKELWVRQLVALRALDRLGFTEAIAAAAGRMAKHPWDQIRLWMEERRAGRARAAAGDTLTTTNGGVELVRVPGGKFLMGSPQSERGRYDFEGPQHQVEVSSFRIGKYPVTNDQYALFLRANPGVEEPPYWSDRQFNGARQPVVGVTWDEARQFARWIGGRLPSEAEWEYATRAATTEPYLEGDDEKALDRVAWYAGNAGRQTRPVGEKAPNAWGLHDVLGNVWEWVEDDWHGNYRGAPGGGRPWGDSPRGEERVVRGGSFVSEARDLRCAVRRHNLPIARGHPLGFRCARDP
jgi:formylglycine-generating enzyme required for sulfatase activity